MKETQTEKSIRGSSNSEWWKLSGSLALKLYGQCAFDDKNDRVLDGYYETNDEMTIQQCLKICSSKGFRYSGLEWACECHCGNEPDQGFEWAWPDKCDDSCSGDSHQICGGSGAMRKGFLDDLNQALVRWRCITVKKIALLLKTPNFSVYTTPTEEVDGQCIYDFPSNRRVLDEFSITGLTNLTILSCANFCTEYEFFGVQGGNECYCGNDDSKFLPTPIPGECNMPCSGDPMQVRSC